MTGRNKNIVCGALLCTMMLSMTACGNEIPDLTEEESQRVGEYAAVTLLKYDCQHGRFFWAAGRCQHYL